MDRVQAALSVFFEEPFWVGVIERVEDGKLTVCRVTFGAEPRGFEVYEFFLKNYYALRFSPSVEATVRSRPTNPKRMQREVRKQMNGGAGGKSKKDASRAQSSGNALGTKSQQALKLQREQMKTERRISARERKSEDRERKFELKQRKRKEKHRGK